MRNKVMKVNTGAGMRGRLKRKGKMLILYLLLLAGITVFSLWLANTGIRHAEGFAALREWMYETRYGWLIWRLCVYCTLGWWGWKIWHAPGFRQEYRAPFLRMATVSVLFVLLCEYSIFAGSGR